MRRLASSVGGTALLMASQGTAARSLSVHGGNDKGTMAKQALLQFNVMVEQGVEPDVLMYTTLINTFADAKMEWQAYKMFSRMLEQGLTPIPETYLALKRATSPGRQRLRDDIERKMRSLVEEMPRKLHEASAGEREAAEKSSQAMHKLYSMGELPPPPSSAPVVVSSDAAGDNGRLRGNVRLYGMQATWDAHETMLDEGAKRRERSRAESPETIAAALDQLHEEELRIFLTTHRQLRHGSKAELVSRIVEFVSPTAIEAMLARRRHFFAAVREELEDQMRLPEFQEGEKSGSLDSAKDDKVEDTKTPTASTAIQGGDAASALDDFLASDEAITPSAVANDSIDTAVDLANRSVELVHDEVVPTSHEKLTSSKDAMLTPWGMIRKPLFLSGDTAGRSTVNPARTPTMEESELDLMFAALGTDEVERIPADTLRKYARVYRLKWQRKGDSLQEAVIWHMKTHGRDGGAASPTLTAAERRQEVRDLKASMEAHDVINAIASRAKHMKVVDSRETQMRSLLSTKQRGRDDRAAAIAGRQMKNLEGMQKLRAQAQSYQSQREEQQPDSHIRVLGTGSGEEGATEAADELPPWALRLGSDKFDLQSGRFGDPSRGVITESGMGNFVVEPSEASSRQHSFDKEYLSGKTKKNVETALETDADQDSAVTQMLARKEKSHKYRRNRAFIERAKAKAKAERAENSHLQPPEEPKRMSKLLTRRFYKPKMRAEEEQ